MSDFMFAEVREFFAPWNEFWEAETVKKEECHGKLQSIRSENGFSNTIPPYRALVASLKDSKTEDTLSVDSSCSSVSTSVDTQY